MKKEIKNERERIKKVLKENWNKINPRYKTKLRFIFALIDEEINEEEVLK